MTRTLPRRRVRHLAPQHSHSSLLRLWPLERHRVRPMRQLARRWELRWPRRPPELSQSRWRGNRWHPPQGAHLATAQAWHVQPACSTPPHVAAAGATSSREVTAAEHSPAGVAQAVLDANVAPARTAPHAAAAAATATAAAAAQAAAEAVSLSRRRALASGARAAVAQTAAASGRTRRTQVVDLTAEALVRAFHSSLPKMKAEPPSSSAVSAGAAGADGVPGEEAVCAPRAADCSAAAPAAPAAPPAAALPDVAVKVPLASSAPVAAAGAGSEAAEVQTDARCSSAAEPAMSVATEPASAAAQATSPAAQMQTREAAATDVSEAEAAAEMPRLRRRAQPPAAETQPTRKRGRSRQPSPAEAAQPQQSAAHDVGASQCSLRLGFALCLEESCAVMTEMSPLCVYPAAAQESEAVTAASEFVRSTVAASARSSAPTAAAGQGAAQQAASEQGAAGQGASGQGAAGQEGAGQGANREAPAVLLPVRTPPKNNHSGLAEIDAQENGSSVPPAVVLANSASCIQQAAAVGGGSPRAMPAAPAVRVLVSSAASDVATPPLDRSTGVASPPVPQPTLALAALLPTRAPELHGRGSTPEPEAVPEGQHRLSSLLLDSPPRPAAHVTRLPSLSPLRNTLVSPLQPALCGRPSPSKALLFPSFSPCKAEAPADQRTADAARPPDVQAGTSAVEDIAAGSVVTSPEQRLGGAQGRARPPASGVRTTVQSAMSAAATKACAGTRTCTASAEALPPTQPASAGCRV